MIVLLPSYREKALAESVERVKEMGYRVAVACVKGDKLCNAKADWAFFAEERGKGVAMRLAFQELLAESNGKEDILVMDADLTYPLERIPHFEKALDSYDVAWGDRYRRGRVRQALWKRLGNHIISATASLLFKAPLWDVTSGMYALSPKALKAVAPCLRAKHFEIEADIITEVVRQGLSLTWVPISYEERKASHIRWRDGFAILRFLIAKALSKPCARAKGAGGKG